MKFFKCIICIAFGVVSCVSIPKPGSSLKDVDFSVFPHIVDHSGKYFLQYQIKVREGQKLNKSLARVVYCKIISDKGYYFFSIPISHFERGKLVERSIGDDGLLEFIKSGRIYWLNEDGSEVKLEIES